MNKKKNNQIKEQHLTETQQLKKEKMLLQLQKEIESIEYDIQHSKINNAKIETIRNLKIGARALQLVAPYVLTASIIAGGFTYLGRIPFYGGDKYKAYSNVMTEFDNAGNIRYEQQYDIFENSSNKLFYCTKWEQNEDGLYSRIVQTYSIGKKTYKDIIELFEQKNLKLEDIFDKPDSTIKETKNNITEEELQAEPCIKAIIYSIDKNDYIVCTETVGENILTSILYVLITLMCEFIPAKIRRNVSSFDFEYCVDRIKEKYPLVDTKELVKKLEIKRSNYNRLTR